MRGKRKGGADRRGFTLARSVVATTAANSRATAAPSSRRRAAAAAGAGVAAFLRLACRVTVGKWRDVTA